MSSGVKKAVEKVQNSQNYLSPHRETFCHSYIWLTYSPKNLKIRKRPKNVPSVLLEKKPEVFAYIVFIHLCEWNMFLKRECFPPLEEEKLWKRGLMSNIFYSVFITRVLAGALTKIVHILVNIQTPLLRDGISTGLFGFIQNPKCFNGKHRIYSMLWWLIFWIKTKWIAKAD